VCVWLYECETWVEQFRQKDIYEKQKDYFCLLFHSYLVFISHYNAQRNVYKNNWIQFKYYLFPLNNIPTFLKMTQIKAIVALREVVCKRNYSAQRDRIPHYVELSLKSECLTLSHTHTQ
jgi:hypothetical protein